MLGCVRLGSALLVCALFAYSQNPIKIEPREMQNHRVGRPKPLHSDFLAYEGWNDLIRLEVIVDTSGQVESAQAISGPLAFFSQAEEIERNRRFKPFQRDGMPVRASFDDGVAIASAERWADTEVPFPQINDWNTLVIRLKRTRCYGPCPSYSVEVHGNGEVEFSGISNVSSPGRHSTKISKELVQQLVAAFREANYFSLRDEYVAPITDLPTFTTSIEFDNSRKSVKDYAGSRAGMPDALMDLEDNIDRIAGTEKWIKGNGQSDQASLESR